METQELLFQQIRESLPSHLSFVDELSELLKISYDSAYRRIRGEKELSFSELSKLCKHFGISIDCLFNIGTDKVIFKHIPVVPPDFGIKQWLKKILVDLQKIQHANVSEIIYAAKDPPVFHYFQFPEIGAFKMFFWEKTIFQFPQLADKKFTLKYVDEEIGEIGEKILTTSLKIPTTEIWNEDTFNITFKQIENYWISGLFEKKEDIHVLCDKFHLWINHIKKQAELGYKFYYGAEPIGVENSFKFYENEVVLNDNTIFVKANNFTATYITYNVLSLLLTTDPVFCAGVENYMKGILKESVLISTVNAKERNRFFNNLLSKIEKFQMTVN
ncbi:MAG: helix-turn-helix transcriptional regulator [Bacteroidales bacterium]|nr:helix-turn-helix transcriptional regulator [Bacteroidales bacterium]